MGKNGHKTKRELMESAYSPGMNAEQLQTAVTSQFNADISQSYVRQFLSLHDGRTQEAKSQAQVWELELLKESLTRLEQALYAPGWERLTMRAQEEFTREGLRKIVELARIMRLKNPVIRRGVNIQKLYVWAQGMTVTAVDGDINATIQAFMDDEKNRAELTTHQARSEKEVDLQTEANFFIRFFINEKNGRVRVRFIPFDEITNIICNPEDGKDQWFYERRQTKIENGVSTQHTAYYPDWQYNPKSKAGQSAGGQISDPNKIQWDTPVYHVAVNRFGKFGVCEFYDALDWALAFKSFLEQLASVWQALARWAHKLSVPGGKKGVASAKSKLGTTLTTGNQESNPPPVTGSMFIQSGEADLQPFRTAGATMSAEDGRRLLLMAAMPFGFPETFYGDASVGSLATAKSLDRPTELKIRDRQQLWTDIHRNIFNFVTLWATKAPQGALKGVGSAKKEPDGQENREFVEWSENIDPSIDIRFPPIIEGDIPQMTAAVIDSATMKGAGNGVPMETAVGELLRLLGIQEPDEVMALWREEQEARAERAERMADMMQQSDGDDGTQEALTNAIAAVNDAIAIREGE